jgi:hypothetical protein
LAGSAGAEEFPPLVGSGFAAPALSALAARQAAARTLHPEHIVRLEDSFIFSLHIS